MFLQEWDMKVLLVGLSLMLLTGCAMTAEFSENKCTVDRGMLVKTPDGWEVDTRQKSLLEGLITPEKIEIET